MKISVSGTSDSDLLCFSISILAAVFLDLTDLPALGQSPRFPIMMQLGILGFRLLDFLLGFISLQFVVCLSQRVCITNAI